MSSKYVALKRTPESTCFLALLCMLYSYFCLLICFPLLLIQARIKEHQEEQIQYIKDKSVFPVENIAVLSSICKTEFSKDIRCSNERLEKMTERLNERCIRLTKKLKEQNLALPKNTKDKDDDLHR